MARFNLLAKGRHAIENWADANPQEQGETKAKYRRRMKAGVKADLKNDAVGSVWLALLPYILQILPMLIEMFLNRKK